MGGKRRVPESGFTKKGRYWVMRGFLLILNDLERQIELIKSKEKEWDIEILKDIGSGLREDRRNFNAKNGNEQGSF